LVAAELRKGHITNSNLKGANLSRITALASSFKGSDLTLARFNGANLTGADFSEAILLKTDFNNANLGAAKFDGADLSGAKLASAIGLKPEQLDTACGDGKTQLPIDLTISYCKEQAEDTVMHDLDEHSPLAARDREIALRTERAIQNIEFLMKKTTPEGRRALQKVHADLLAIRRKIEE